MTTPLKDLAIQCALQNNWLEATRVNKKLLEENPRDLDALNRLAFSLMKLGKFKAAKQTYKKVTSHDPTNPIALKNLKKLDAVSKQKNYQAAFHQNGGTSLHDLFIEEAGKTRTVELKNTAERKTLSLLQPGDTIHLLIKRNKIFAQDAEKTYIGMLPDDIGMRLISFMKGGNEYQAYIKGVDEQNATIFIKEIKRANRFKNQSSFSFSGYSFAADSDAS